jgi:hypothetical protein
MASEAVSAHFAQAERDCVVGARPAMTKAGRQRWNGCPAATKRRTIAKKRAERELPGGKSNMRRFAGTVLLFASALFCGGALAQQQPMALPEVTVTAPASPNEVRPTSQGAPGNPYFGNVRVEETKWPEVPCAASRVGAATPGTCRRGPPQINLSAATARDRGSSRTVRSPTIW